MPTENFKLLNVYIVREIDIPCMSILRDFRQKTSINIDICRVHNKKSLNRNISYNIG